MKPWRWKTGITFDIVIADYEMPEIDGIQFLNLLERYLDLPFISFTGKGREEIVIDAINNGTDDYVRKDGTLQPGLPRLPIWSYISLRGGPAVTR